MEEKVYTYTLLRYSNEFVMVDNHTGYERVVPAHVAKRYSNQVDVYVDDTAKKML